MLIFSFIAKAKKMQFIGDLHSIKLRVEIGRKLNYGIYYIASTYTHCALLYHVSLDVITFFSFELCALSFYLIKAK